MNFNSLLFLGWIQNIVLSPSYNLYTKIWILFTSYSSILTLTTLVSITNHLTARPLPTSKVYRQLLLQSLALEGLDILAEEYIVLDIASSLCTWSANRLSSLSSGLM